ncbi:MAG: hypothetical protein WC341_03410 [Bacteroidales bacterium]|jgi:DnaJ-class molecular chaperone
MTTECPHCNATGVCDMCYATGIVRYEGTMDMVYDAVTKQPKRCVHCRGTGKCTYCGGSGIKSKY